MAGSYNVEYRVEDGDANTASSDAATLSFTVTVAEPPEPDTAPSFGSQTVPNQSYTVGVSISALLLPQASGGNGLLSYALTPSILGLTFAQNSRTLTGTPTTAKTHNGCRMVTPTPLPATPRRSPSGSQCRNRPRHTWAARQTRRLGAA